MITMTYTNTFKGQTVTEKVMVSCAANGRTLIAAWNGQSPANDTFFYQVIDFQPVTKEDLSTLGWFDESNVYHLSEQKQAFFDRVHASR
jgi:hypothetical protein